MRRTSNQTRRVTPERFLWFTLLAAAACGRTPLGDIEGVGDSTDSGGRKATGGTGGSGAGSASTGGSNGNAGADSGPRANVPGPCMVDVAASYSHACAVRSDNTLWCWGTNRSGELGTGTTTDSPSPIQVSDLGKDVVGVTPGAAHTCARKSDGTLWCWGANRIGELGNGTTDGRSRPIQVAALGTSVLEVSADTHTCARKSDGTLWCWGDDYWGQLGDGRLLWSSAVPAQVALLGAHVIAVGEANGSHLCAIKSDGTLWCWGDNDGGRLGDGSTKGSRWPVQVSALGSRVVQVATGYGHTCAITSDARLWCWGRNSAGELGNGTTVESPGPVAVALEARVVQVTAGRGFTCARKNDNTLWCWGMDDNGEVGDGRTSESFCGNAAGCRLLPVQVGPPCDQSG